MKPSLVWIYGWMLTLLGRRQSAMLCLVRFVVGILAASSMLGCTARYSAEALQAMAPGAEYAEVCARPPTVPNDRAVFAYNIASQRTVSDENWDEFEQFAKTADIIYRYDPNAPEKTASRLPWPYHTMSCNSLAAGGAEPLREGMREIPISDEMRQALASALIDKASVSLRKPADEEDQSFRFNGSNKQYFGDRLFLGPYVDGRSPSERLEATGQMLRDAIRAILPKVPGPKDEQISIIDTDAGQVIGGVGAGTAIGWVPGGVLIADAMEKSPQIAKPTPQFQFGQGTGQMLSGAAQIGGGTTLFTGGAGMSATGVGLVAGIPTCTVGVLLIANGTITFVKGAHTVLVAACNWHELDNMQPLAAVAPKDAAPAAPPPQANAATTPASTPPAKPAAVPAQAAKPAATPAKPVAKPNTPSSGQPKAATTTTTTKTFTRPPSGVDQIRNKHLAGKKHPVTGVPFDADGFPDFRAAGVVKHEVKIKFSGSRPKDFEQANKAAKLQKTPDDYTWHHHQDGTTMQLVPMDIHNKTGHTGGMAFFKRQP